MQSEPSGGRPPSFTAPASIAPVGLEAPSDADAAEDGVGPYLEPPKDRAAQTGSIQLPLRRRRLGGIVIATVGGCGLLLVAAVIARVSHASSEPRGAPASMKDVPAAVATNAPAVANGSTATPRGEPAATPPRDPSAVAAPTAPVAEAPTSGTVRVVRPATPGRVWLDGKKLGAPSAVVMCGPHQIKVGAAGRARPVQVPCGGELVVSR